MIRRVHRCGGAGGRLAAAVLLGGVSGVLPSPRPEIVERRVAATVERRVASTVERRVAAMGTTLDVAVVAAERETALNESEAAIAEVRRIEDLLTTWRESPLSRLNEAPVGAWTPLDAELCSVLADVFSWAERTRGAFDPAVAPLVEAWGLRGPGRIPSAGDLAAARAAAGAGRFRVDRERCGAVRLGRSAGIEEGAWGKGYALDRAARRLEQMGARRFLIDLGGQVVSRGRDSSGAAWSIAIAHPRDRRRPVVSITLRDASASTSGNSERGRTVGGRRVGHELDPRTGEPATDFGSVTVIAPSGLVADILSTAFFVLGPEAGLSLSEDLRREGVQQEALFLIDRGDSKPLQAVASPGLSRLVLSADATAVAGLSRNAP